MSAEVTRIPLLDLPAELARRGLAIASYDPRAGQVRFVRRELMACGHPSVCAREDGCLACKRLGLPASLRVRAGVDGADVAPNSEEVSDAGE